MTKEETNNALSTKVVEKLKKELVERKNQILEDLKDISVGDSRKTDRRKVKFPDFGDKADENAQEISEYSTNLATEKVLKKTLRDMENALKRMDDGVYGTCKYCKNPIGEKRMVARPVASACISCKTKLQNS